MTAYREYYKGQDEKQKRQYDKPKRVKKFCWKLGTDVQFEGARCLQDGCLHRHSEGCMEDVRMVV